MNFSSGLSEALRTSRPVEVLTRSWERGRLAHGMLIFGDDFHALDDLAHHLAAALLETDADHVRQHPDLFVARPMKKGRQIGVEETRELIRGIQHTSNRGGRKVALISEADRLNQASANMLLKTLEEPPAGSHLLLLTTRPYDLLPTIRSRCFLFRLPAGAERPTVDAWEGWRARYGEWIEGLLGDLRSQDAADPVFGLYGLITQYSDALNAQLEATWAEEKDRLPADLPAEMVEALEAGTVKGVRLRCWQDIEQTTRRIALAGKVSRDRAAALTQAVEVLEQAIRLSDVFNLKDDAALEFFLLRSLRIWTRRIGQAA